MEFDIKPLLSELGIDYRLEGTNKNVKAVASVYEAKETDVAMCYYEGEKGVSIISNSNAGIILCTEKMEGLVHPKAGKQQFLFVQDPKTTLVCIMHKIYKNELMTGISQRATISETARIGSDCYIGDNVVIGNNCSVGNKTIIHDGATLVRDCTVGNNCVIQSGVTIGADGFAYVRYETGELVKFPHMRKVKIENNVEICANTNIARGSLSDTIIGEGTKIDALVQIAHNVVLGKNCMITAGTIIGGSTKVGDMSWTGLNSTLKDRIKVGNNVLIAAGAAVMHDVEDSDIVAGVPAKSIKHKVKTTPDKLFLMAGQKENQNKSS